MSENQKGKFIKENDKIYYTIDRGDNLTEIAKKYMNSGNIPKTSQTWLIDLIIEVNKKEFSSIRRDSIKEDWKIRMPSYNEVNAMNKEVHTVHFDGKKVQWKDYKKNILFSAEAVSGLKRNHKKIKKLIEMGRTDIQMGVDYTDKKYQNVLDAGPIPEGTYYIELRKDVPRDQTGGGYGWGGWQLKPRSSILKAVGWLEKGDRIDVPYFRSGFYLHEDAGNDGTSGCIGINKQSDTIKIWGMLKEYQEKGHSEIEVIVRY